MPLYPWRTAGWGSAALADAPVGRGRRSCSRCRTCVSFASLEAPWKLPLYTRNKLAQRRSTRSTATPWRWHKDTSRRSQISPAAATWRKVSPAGLTAADRQTDGRAASSGDSQPRCQADANLPWFRSRATKTLRARAWYWQGVSFYRSPLLRLHACTSVCNAQARIKLHRCHTSEDA